MYEDDILLRYLDDYYKKHGKITDITSDHVAYFENQHLNVGRMLSSIRTNHRNYTAGIDTKNGSHSKRSIKRYEFLDAHDFIWDPDKEKVFSDRFLKYLEEHYKKYGTLNNIRQNDVVIFEEKPLNVGNILSKVRENHKCYIDGEKNEHGSHSELSLKRYEFLDAHDFIWESQDEDIYLDFLNDYYKKHGTLKEIVVADVVIYKKQELRVKDFISHIRANHKCYINGINNKNGSHSESNIKRYKFLEEHGFIWEPQIERVKNDIYLKFLEEYYKEHETLNNIPTNSLIEYDGQQLNMREFFRHIRKNHRSYVNGIDTKNGSHSEGNLKRYKFLDEHNFIWEPTKERLETVNSLATKIGVAHSTLKKYIELFDGDVSKAIRICKLNKELRENKESNKKTDYCMKNILETFEVDIDALTKLLNKSVLRADKKAKKVMYTEKQSLRDFCLTNGYNYDVIIRAVKLKMSGLCDENLESVINRSIIDYRNNGQNKPSTWIYSKYGNEVLVKHFLLAMNLNPNNILLDMSKNCISLEEAVKNESFKRSASKEHSYLEPLYHNFVDFYNKKLHSDDYNELTISDNVKEYMEKLITDYSLTSNEYNAIYESFDYYLNAIYTYHLLDVGFEKDEKKKIEKIITYNFDEDDIEEAYFSPLKFDNKVLLGRDSELAKRRNLIKNLTTGWQYLSEEEKQTKITKYNLTSEETTYILKSREELDTIKEKVENKHSK